MKRKLLVISLQRMLYSSIDVINCSLGEAKISLLKNTLNRNTKYGRMFVLSVSNDNNYFLKCCTTFSQLSPMEIHRNLVKLAAKNNGFYVFNNGLPVEL